MNPLLSVLLLTYNHEDYIGESIESALNQKTNFDYEILIGEDCSTDNTGKIVKEYAAKYPGKIRLINSETNVGAIKNEQRLYEASKGKYIAFLEGDDFWVDILKLQKQVDFLENNPDYGLVHGEINHYYQESGLFVENYNKKNNYKISDTVFYDLLIKPGHHIKTMTVCYRKEIVEKYFDYKNAIKSGWLLTDLPIWLDISQNSKVHYLEEPLATYRILPESASNTKNKKRKYEFHASVYEILFFYISKYNLPNTIKNEVTFNMHKTFFIDFTNMKDFKQAKIHLDYLKINKKSISVKLKTWYYIKKLIH